MRMGTREGAESGQGRARWRLQPTSAWDAPRCLAEGPGRACAGAPSPPGGTRAVEGGRQERDGRSASSPAAASWKRSAAQLGAAGPARYGPAIGPRSPPRGRAASSLSPSLPARPAARAGRRHLAAESRAEPRGTSPG